MKPNSTITGSVFKAKTGQIWIKNEQVKILVYASSCEEVFLRWSDSLRVIVKAISARPHKTRRNKFAPPRTLARLPNWWRLHCEASENQKLQPKEFLWAHQPIRGDRIDGCAAWTPQLLNCSILAWLMLLAVKEYMNNTPTGMWRLI